MKGVKLSTLPGSLKPIHEKHFECPAVTIRRLEQTELFKYFSEWYGVQSLDGLWGHVHQQVDKLHIGPHGEIPLMATPSTCIQFKPLSSYFALDQLQPGYRLLELAGDGSIRTNVYRVPGNRFSPDNEASGY